MVDTYTKWMLTIIATALVIITANNIMHMARAEIGYARVQICDERNCAQLIPFNARGEGEWVTMWGLPIVPAR